jgi:hypothetical protein
MPLRKRRLPIDIAAQRLCGCHAGKALLTRSCVHIETERMQDGGAGGSNTTKQQLVLRGYSLLMALARSIREASRAGMRPAREAARSVVAREIVMIATGAWKSIVQPKDCLLMT